MERIRRKCGGWKVEENITCLPASLRGGRGLEMRDSEATRGPSHFPDFRDREAKGRDEWDKFGS